MQAKRDRKQKETEVIEIDKRLIRDRRKETDTARKETDTAQGHTQPSDLAALSSTLYVTK